MLRLLFDGACSGCIATGPCMLMEARSRSNQDRISVGDGSSQALDLRFHYSPIGSALGHGRYILARFFPQTGRGRCTKRETSSTVAFGEYRRKKEPPWVTDGCHLLWASSFPTKWKCVRMHSAPPDCVVDSLHGQRVGPKTDLLGVAHAAEAPYCPATDPLAWLFVDGRVVSWP